MGNPALSLSSELIRAARALLRWEQRDLANASSVSLPTIKRLESRPGPLGAHGSTVAALRKALEFGRALNSSTRMAAGRVSACASDKRKKVKPTLPGHHCARLTKCIVLST